MPVKDRAAYYVKNRDKIREQQREYYNRRGYKRHAEKMYGVTPEQYDEMVKAQDGRCAICGVQPLEDRLVVDHCHKDDHVRGLLCRPCNCALGFFKDSVDSLQGAIEYLQDTQTDSVQTTVEEVR